MAQDTKNIKVHTPKSALTKTHTATCCYPNHCVCSYIPNITTRSHTIFSNAYHGHAGTDDGPVTVTCYIVMLLCIIICYYIRFAWTRCTALSTRVMDQSAPKPCRAAAAIRYPVLRTGTSSRY